MSTFELVSSDSVPLTRELAEKHRDMPGSPTERELNPKRVQFLEKKIGQGLFLPPAWAIVKFAGKDLRMNGQHSSIALSNASEEKFPAGLKVHMDTYKVEAKEGMTDLFRQFDCRQSSRTTVDVSGAFMKLEDALFDVNPACGLNSVKGVAWYRKNVIGTTAPSGDDVGQLFHEPLYHPFILWMDSIEWKKAGELKPTPVIAAMFATFDRSDAEAKEFWDAVIYRRNQFDDEHPTTVLENYLCAVQRREDPFRNGNKPLPAALFEACIQAWNAYRSEKPLTMKVLRKVDPKKKGLSEAA